MQDLYFGRGNEEQFEEYIDFINYVFGFNGNETSFPKLLPKLYRPELNPAGNSFLAMEDGKIKAAVGTFPTDISVCGNTLKGIGIGNVSVHPYARSKGYMKKLVNMAVEDMIAVGADFSSLGGQRQRYNYFSFDYTGTVYQYRVHPTNIRHIYGDAPATLTLTEVGAGDALYLDAIAALTSSNDYVPIRPRENLYPILRTWEAQPYIFQEDDRILGYCVVQDKTVTEILAARETDFPAMVCTLTARFSGVEFRIPEFQPTYREVLEKLAESITVTSAEMFSVFCYRRVLKAFLQLKSTYTALPDGMLHVLIHGRAGDEDLLISVNHGAISVECTPGSAENVSYLELSHLEAMRFFFAPDSISRRNAPAFAKLWFPLPLWLYSADCV